MLYLNTRKISGKECGGYVTFDITHCSDYFLTMSVVKNAEGANNNGVIIIGMLVIIVGLVGYTIFKNNN